MFDAAVVAAAPDAATERGVIALQTRLRYTTMVVLPEGEEILDVLCGDRDFWVISATHNIAHVKPAKAGAQWLPKKKTLGSRVRGNGSARVPRTTLRLLPRAPPAH